MTVLPRRLAVCADDYGLGPAVDHGILVLAAQSRISAVSALATAPRWHLAGPALRDCPARVGLHFNLTEGEPASTALAAVWPRMPGLHRLLQQAGLRRLPGEAVAAELQAQWQRFVDVVGRPPAFIDGHQHVHALPGVREHVLALARAQGLPVRNTGRVLGPGFAFKRAVIEHCGGRALAHALARRGVAHATALVGVYGFDPRADYGALVRSWLRAAPDGALLFCHPALGGREAGDAIAEARLREMAYLGGAAFADDLAEAGVSVGEPLSGS